jgi:hypothetical protein
MQLQHVRQNTDELVTACTTISTLSKSSHHNDVAKLLKIICQENQSLQIIQNTYFSKLKLKYFENCEKVLKNVPICNIANFLINWKNFLAVFNNSPIKQFQLNYNFQFLLYCGYEKIKIINNIFSLSSKKLKKLPPGAKTTIIDRSMKITK